MTPPVTHGGFVGHATPADDLTYTISPDGELSLLGVTFLSAGACANDDLPEVLLRHGIDEPRTPITVIFVSPFEP